MRPEEMDLDRRVRLAALNAIKQITANSGGVITREQMTHGFEFEAQRIPLSLRARGIWKPGILGRDGAAISILTSPSGPYDDQVASDEEWFEYRYQGTDPSAADNRAVRKACQLGLPLIYFYRIVPGLYEAMAPVYVVGDDPVNLTFRIAADATGVGDPSLMHGGGTAPLKAYATTTAKIRLHQRRFRQLVMAAYDGSCAVCRLRHSELLDAAHILEDRDVRGNPEVPNGLALCGVHHGAYDAFILGIDPDRRIHIRRDILEEVDGPMLKHGLQEMNGRLIDVPGRGALRPNRDYLAERFARFEEFRAA